MSESQPRLQHEFPAPVPGTPVTYDVVPQAGSQGKGQFQAVMGVVSAALRRHWKVVLPLSVLLSAIAGAIVYVTFVPKYRAVAWLQMHDVAPYVAFPHRDDSRRFLATQTELMRTPLVLAPVLARPDIAEILETENRKKEDPVRWLADQIQVRGVGNSELFTVAFEATDPSSAAKVVNAVVDSYLGLREQEEYQQSLTVLEVLDGEMERRAAKIKRMRETVRELSKQLTGTDPYASTTTTPDGQTELKYSVLADLRSRLALAEVEEEVLKAEIAAYERVVGTKQVKVPETNVMRAVEADPRVQQLEAALVGYKQRLRDYERTLADGKNSPTYKRLEAEIQANEKRLEELRAELTKQAREQLLQQATTEREDRLLSMKAQLESYRIKRQLLRERYEEELRNAKQFAGDTFELEMQREELAREQRVLDLIEDRAIQLRTELGAPSRVRLLQRAQPPGSPVEDLPYKKLILAVLAGLLLPVGAAVGWEYMIRRVTQPEELEQTFRVPVVGEVARLPRRSMVARARAGQPSNEVSLYEESVDSLRTCLLLSERLRDARSFVITSAANNEGKTSVAVQLAASIARATGHATLLVDGDMRSPDIHKLLGLPKTPGLAELLSKKATLDEVINTSWSSRVHVLPAGQLSASPHSLLGNGTLHPLLKELARRYAYVVIDCPPVLACAESLILAKAADVSLLCARRDVSRMDQVHKASDRLMATGASVGGVVLVGVPTRVYSYRYGRYRPHD